MPGETHNGMQCSEFEALLFDALDSQLTGAKQERFRAHARVCAKCGPMFAEAEAGQHWLKSLAEVEPPANLVNDILAATSGIPSYRLQEIEAGPHQPSLGERIREWADSLLTPVWSTVRQPRFAMSFGMAFFSLSVALSVAGVKPTDIKQADLSRSGLRRTYYTTQARVVKYYENIRLVVEIESKVQEIKKVAQPARTNEERERDRNHKNNTSGEPEPRQERNYSRDENQPALASVPECGPAVSVTTNRRLV
jgi:putative zinc finger protein